MEIMQIHAARIAIGATKLILINALYNETQWKNLQQRRQNHQLIHFYKMSNNLTPHYLSSLISHPVGAISQYSNNLHTLEARTNL